MLMREDVSALPSLDDQLELSSEQIKGYQKNGHIILRGMARADEVSVYEPVISEWMKNDIPLEERSTFGKAFIQVGNLWKQSEAIRRFVLAQRFAKVAADLMGVEGVRIYHDQALYKEPGGGYTPWHQDQIYWPLDTDKTITMWMPLVPISEEVGSMTFASESQKKGFINKMVISDESHRTLGQYIEGEGFEKVSYGAMAAGDATFHGGWTLHSAPNNPTDSMRKVMTVIYFADGTRVVEPETNARQKDLETWLPGLTPGDQAASSLNPILYHR